MDKKLYYVYREIEDRFVNNSRTNKVQKIQAGLYPKKSNCQKWLMAIANGVTNQVF